MENAMWRFFCRILSGIRYAHNIPVALKQEYYSEYYEKVMAFGGILPGFYRASHGIYKNVK